MKLGNKILLGQGEKLPVGWVQNGTPAAVAGPATVDVPYPTSPTAGNLLVAIMFPYNPTSDVLATGWEWHGSTSDGTLEQHYLSKVADGTETGNVTFSVDGSTPSRFFGIIVEYSGGTGTISSVDGDNARGTSTTDAFNNGSLPTTDESLYVACFGTTNSTVPSDTPNDYTKRLDTGFSNNGLLLFDNYVASKDTDDGSDITTATASSFHIFAGCIIE